MRCAVLPALALAVAAASAAPPPLAQLLHLAEENHDSFRVHLTEYRISEEGAPLARAELLPQTSATFTQQHSSNEESNWSAGISVSQSLYDMYKWRQWQAAQARVDTAALRLAAARQELHRDVILLWLDVQLAAETLRLVETRRKTLRAQLARTEAFAASGQVIEADVLSARARLANAQSQWEQARHDLAVARDEVMRLTTADTAEMRLLLDTALPHLPPLPFWLQRVEERNLAAHAVRSNGETLRRRLQSAVGALLPRASLNASVSAKDEWSDTRASWQLQVRQPLSTGGALRASQRQLVAEADKHYAELAALLSHNAQAIKRLHGQMRADLARLDALNEEVTARAALLQVVTIGYDNGVNILTEVLSAEEELFDAQMSLRQAAYGYLKNLTSAKALLADADAAFAAQVEALFIPAEH